MAQWAIFDKGPWVKAEEENELKLERDLAAPGLVNNWSPLSSGLLRTAALLGLRGRDGWARWSHRLVIIALRISISPAGFVLLWTGEGAAEGERPS